MSLKSLDRNPMSTQRRLKCACPCGYGFETSRGKEEAVTMVQAHFNQFHADMLPFGLTTIEALALLTPVDNNRKPRPTIYPEHPTHPTTPYSAEKTSEQNKAKKKPQVLIQEI